MGNAEEAYIRWLEDIGHFPRRTDRARVNAPSNRYSKLRAQIDLLAAGMPYSTLLHTTKPASAKLSVNGQMVKSITWSAPVAKRMPAPTKPPRRVVIVRRAPSPADRVKTAFDMLAGGDISPRQRIAMTAALAGLNSAPAQPLLKALPSHEDPSAAPAASDEPHSPRGLAARLKEIQGHLDRHAEASHIAEAERLLASAQRMLANPERMSMGDHAALSISLSDLRHKIQRSRHV
jgi:hypothetical protein